MCAHTIDVLDAPPDDRVVVAGAVAVPDPVTALQANPSGVTDPAVRFFAKSGLVVRADAAVELRVPADAADRLRIGWGSPPQPGPTLYFPGCPDRGEWLAFAGGYWVTEPACLPLEIRADGRIEQIRIGVGVACAGGSPTIVSR